MFYGKKLLPDYTGLLMKKLLLQLSKAKSRQSMPFHIQPAYRKSLLKEKGIDQTKM